MHFMSAICEFCALTDYGTHRTLCDSVGTKLSDFHLNEIPEVRRLVWTTSAGTWRYTLGMSAIPDDAASSSRLPSEVDKHLFSCTSDVQVTSPVDSHCSVIFLLFLVPECAKVWFNWKQRRSICAPWISHLEPNMKWIGWCIAELWPFEIFEGVWKDPEVGRQSYVGSQYSSIHIHIIIFV